MSHFIFKAKKHSGEVYTAERDAADRFELYRLLKQGGDEVIEVKEGKSLGGHHIKIQTGALFGHVKTSEKIRFAHNLGAMLEAGLSLVRALSVQLRQSHDKALSDVITGLIADINKGSTLTEAMKKYPKVFQSILVSMVHAGEQSGTLSESLKSAAVQMENSNTLEKRIRGALIYPAVIVCVMLVIGVLMMIFVIPVLMKTFTDLHVQLPFTTQILLDASDLIQHDGILIIVILCAIGGLFYWWARKDYGRKIVDSLILKIPIIGGLIQEVNIARTARTLSSLMNSGVEVVESVSITSNVVQNVHFREVLDKAGTAIAKGELMSKIFGEYTKLYSDFFVEMLSVGEETGKTGDMLLEVAKYYEDEIEQKTKNMSTLIEPILMVCIGGAVGFFAISIISPIYSLVGAM